MTTNRTPIQVGQRVAQTAGAEVNVFVPGQGGKMPSSARLYAVEFTADAKMDHFPSRWPDRANTDSDITLHGVIKDPNAPDEDQNKPVEMEIGVCGVYSEQAGKDLAGKPRVQEFYQLLIALGEKTQEQADQEIASGTPIDASAWVAQFKQRLAQTGGKFTLPAYHRFKVAYFRPRNAGDTGDVGVAGNWTRVTSMAVYQAQIESGSHVGMTREEFEAKNADRILKLKMQHGLDDAAPAQGGATAPAQGGYNVTAPNVPPAGGMMGGMAQPNQGMTTAQAFMGATGVPPTS